MVWGLPRRYLGWKDQMTREHDMRRDLDTRPERDPQIHTSSSLPSPLIPSHPQTVLGLPILRTTGALSSTQVIWSPPGPSGIMLSHWQPKKMLQHRLFLQISCVISHHTIALNRSGNAWFYPLMKIMSALHLHNGGDMQCSIFIIACSK